MYNSKIISTPLLVIFFLTFFSCQSESPEQKNLNVLHEEVMFIHDDVMPKMRDIYKLRRSLKKLTQTDEILLLVSNLESADDSMMDWMAQYKKPKVDDVEHISYLKEQKELITEVRNNMLEAIAAASNYLDK